MPHRRRAIPVEWCLSEDNTSNLSYGVVWSNSFAYNVVSKSERVASYMLMKTLVLYINL